MPGIPSHPHARGSALLAGIALHVMALCVPLPVGAHEFWFAPSRYTARPGVSVDVRAYVGDGFRGSIQGFPAGRAARFEARMGRTFPLGPYTRKGSLVWARIAPSDSGGVLVVWESEFVRNELPAERFEAYLVEDGLDEALKRRRESGESGPGVERYRRCAKTWIDGVDAARAMKPAELPLEIVPSTVPGRDSTLSIRVLFEGKPVSGILVRAWRTPIDSKGTPLDAETRSPVEESWQGRTDSKGHVVVACSQPGEWLIGAVHMVRSRNPSAADWESSWASLTFAKGIRSDRDAR